MAEVFLCDGLRTPIGKYAGALSEIRVDDLAALPLKALIKRNPSVDWEALDDVILGCANQAGEDNRNVARMALLLSGMPTDVPGVTLNRLCGSGLSAIAMASAQIRCGEAELMVAGGVEGMSRAPFVVGKAEQAFGRGQKFYDTTMGWRFVNSALEAKFGAEVMPKTAENIATDFGISREDQDQFALRSQQKAARAQANGAFDDEILPVTVGNKSHDASNLFSCDEHPRISSIEKLAALRSLFPDGTVTAGNASGINDGSAALLLASEDAARKYGLSPIARIRGSAAAGVPPRIMGIGPVPATKKLLSRLDLSLGDFDILEINEAFAAQALACIRELGLEDDDARINPLGGAIALGHPLGMSGARIALSAAYQLRKHKGKRALATMCIGVGQGVSLAIESL